MKKITILLFLALTIKIDAQNTHTIHASDYNIFSPKSISVSISDDRFGFLNNLHFVFIIDL